MNDICIGTATLAVPTENNAMISFARPSGELFRILYDGQIIFSDTVKELNSSQLAKEFIDIIETETHTKSMELRHILESYTDSEFESDATKNLIKAKLFDKICELYNF